MWTDSGLVLTSPIGTALDYSNLRPAFRALLKRGEVADDEDPQPAAHRGDAAACAALRSAADHAIAWARADSLTLKTDAHVLPQLTQDAARRMDAVLARA